MPDLIPVTLYLAGGKGVTQVNVYWTRIPRQGEFLKMKELGGDHKETMFKVSEVQREYIVDPSGQDQMIYTEYGVRVYAKKVD